MSLEQGLLENAGFDCQSYSGRGMYGDTCLAVVTDDDVLNLFADLIDNGCGGKPNSEESYYIVKMLRDAKQDSMGKGTVIYWPNIPFEEETEED
jgi:hypothetical protein